MVVLLTGASHTGKTVLAQRLMEQHRISYFSIDFLKMGLIRSKYTDLTPVDDENLLTDYLWPVTREMIKTIIENHQSMIFEGCYVPAGWEKDFEPEYLREIKFICLTMSERYIREKFADIQRFGSLVEDRGDESGLSMDFLLKGNARFCRMCEENNYPCILIDSEYKVDVTL